MLLSVIIVNYNVKDFLEQCLSSVRKAIGQVSSEVIIVDNNSVDASCAMVKEKFPEFTLIENKVNTGFSVANNQAIKIAKGKYVLLLNPDTLVEEDTFLKVVDFMESHPEAGGLGVQMIDGNGHFLPESKRALPTPQVAFYKIFGLSSLFPKSQKFGKYHLTYLDKNQTHEIEILSGAFMLMRKEALDKVGLLDETFFMYGEDIDLSYRIILGGYKNYYFSDTKIIHYKGESTKKGSLNYVKTFYNAMIIFAEKHFGQSARTFIFFIKFAIYMRAAMAMAKRALNTLFIPFLDILLLIGGFTLLSNFWESRNYYEGYYPDILFDMFFPAISLVYVLSMSMLGAYFSPVKISKLLKGIGLGAVLSLVGYALLDEDIRFSRFIILSGAVWAFIILPSYRFVLHHLPMPFRYRVKDKKNFIIVGEEQEANRVSEIIKHNLKHATIIGNVAPDENKTSAFIGRLSQLQETVRIHQAHEVIFCAKNLSSAEIISKMLELNHLGCDFKIASPDGISVIGSNSIHTNGELYQIELNLINSEENKRNKRLLDLFFALLMLLLSPILFLMHKNKKHFFKSLIGILLNRYTFVGYNEKTDDSPDLPRIKQGLISVPNNVEYAKNYTVWKDISFIFKGLRSFSF